jgi:aspartate/methionine/tyrosine aminotransferase
MEIDLFRMERTQCLFENEVEFNLSESGVLPLSLGELVPDRRERAELDALRLRYPHSTGRPRLRENIARFTGCADPACVMVTNGGSEANYTALWTLVGSSDRVAFMLPNYLQGWGVARAYGRQVDPYRLVMRRDAAGAWRWNLDLDSLRKAVRKDTRVIVVTNPNNPTGAVLAEEEMEAILAEARRVGAWILADEIYRGAEVSGPPSPTFWGRYDRVVITSGLSKAFGLPGLRCGWIVAPRSLIARFCRHHDYLTLTPSFLSDHLADLVMEPSRRERVLKRTQAIIAGNLPVLEKWIASHDDVLEYARPVAGAIAAIRYRLPIASEVLMNRLLREQSVLITPGAHFGIGRFIRIGFGYEIEQAREGLRRIDRLIGELKGKGQGARRQPG